MKKLVRFAIPAVLGVVLASCSITLPVNATSNEVGSKVGKASGKCFFQICMGVDASIKSAAKNGNIKKISTVDMKVKNVLGIMVTFETIVTGE